MDRCVVGRLPAVWCLTLLLVPADVRVPAVLAPAAGARRGERAGHAAREGLRETQTQQWGPAARDGWGEQHELLPAAAR